MYYVLSCCHQVSVAVLLDNFVTASMKMDDEERAQRHDEGLGVRRDVET